MNVSAVTQNSTAFSGKYQLNANQEMPNKEACLKRDTMIGVWSAKAKNGDEVAKQLTDFYNTTYNTDAKAPCNINLVLTDAYDANFEDSMKQCGQKFTKLA